jgi:hypothetical protein
MSEETRAQIPAKYLIAEEVAELLRTPLGTLYSWRSRAVPFGPPASRVGKRLLYDREQVIAWVNAQAKVG